MKILAIRIKNLASLEGNTEIDFSQEPLCSAGIFAITGPTGAGKSTLLDALCLALYAKIPRYRFAENGIDITDIKGSTIKQDDVRGILRDGTSDGFAEVDFVGIDGQHYRACWSVRRARNKADGNLQAHEMTLKNVGTNQDIPGKKTELLPEIERLVGLNFEQFTRSVLLAQGDFTAFLKAGKDEKSALLEKLTGTRIYSEISKRIFEHHREQAQLLRDLNTQRQGITTLTAEELLVLKEEKEAITTVIQSTEKQLEDLNKEAAWQEQSKRLQTEGAIARQQYEEANKHKDEALPREHQLQQMIRIQTIKPSIESLPEVKSSFNEKTIQLQQTESESQCLQEQNTVVAQAIEQASIDLADTINTEEKARPSLEEAKKLDVQLIEKAAQIQQAKVEADQAADKLVRQEQQLSELKQKAVGLEEKIQQLHRWKAAQMPRQFIAEREALILSKLLDAKALLEDAATSSARIQTAKANTQVYRHQQQQLEQAQAVLQVSLLQTQQEFDTLKEAIPGIVIADLQQEKSVVDTSLQDIVTIAAHWKLLYRATCDRKELQESAERNKKALEKGKQTLVVVTEQLRTRKVERDTSLKMLEKARLTVAENVERLRAQLVAEEACPVCGSTSHPYAVHHPREDFVLKELEKDYGEIDAQYDQLLAQHSGLEQANEQVQLLIKKQETDLMEKTAEIDSLEKTWQTFQIYTACIAQPEVERSNWLDQQHQEQKSRQFQLQQKIQNYNQQQAQLDVYKRQLDEQHSQWTDAANELKDVERKLQVVQEQQVNSEAELQKATHNLNSIQQELSVYFPTEEWFQNWQADADAFTASITAFATQWRTISLELEEGAKEQIALRGTVTSGEEQVNSLRHQVAQKQERQRQLQTESGGLADRRKAIFNGDNIVSMEARLKKAIGQARQKLDAHKAEKEKVQQHITRTATLGEQLKLDITALQQQQTVLQEKIAGWINTHNEQYHTTLTQEMLYPLLAFTPEWIEAEQTSLRTLADAVTRAKSIWEERYKALEQHSTQRLSERTADEITALVADLKQQLLLQQKIDNEIGFKLQQDETNKAQTRSLLAAIENQMLVVDNWAKLNEIIGSSDGKKFRQIAQEYTLDVLLGYANVHLEILSKRYLLQRIPNSLGLQVVDQDMGDEVRTVYSLSGGESFLVSLALALGLASLSSSRMKVESLFIDEGFGSLDPATLNIAMDALERLHNQGRKVGVISHVQEMTERIPVQIKVSKQQSGRSKVEVIGS
ncbi:AAA family ATPase [Chitinophaga sp. GbtcB8]|uniref:AAA family ATPase n=1 Tax=Chitinophaga sp. GbtcB8 TaxID=2824753 RepID=UPI001C30AF3A|nr:AAA family ATPase [Chitinophaga sp. GbtcB8]